jgi:hypothetical protein
MIRLSGHGRHCRKSEEDERHSVDPLPASRVLVAEDNRVNQRVIQFMAQAVRQHVAEDKDIGSGLRTPRKPVGVRRDPGRSRRRVLLLGSQSTLV